MGWLIRLGLSLALAGQVVSGLQGSGANSTEHPALFSYLIREHFNEPWRVPGTYARVREQAWLLLTLEACLAVYLRRRGRSG